MAFRFLQGKETGHPGYWEGPVSAHPAALALLLAVEVG